MPETKVVPVRFYDETDEDVIAWLDGLPRGEGNNTIKAMLRAGIAVSQNGKTHAISAVAPATFDQASLEATLESFLPRIREMIEASLASVRGTPPGRETVSHQEEIASPDLLKGHLLSDEEGE